MNSAHKDQGEEADLARLEAALARLGADPRAFPDVDAMASALGVGAIKLKDLFREHLHLQPAAYLQQVRIHAACARLVAGPADLPDLAFAVGFASASAFLQAFRRQTGLSPDAYRTLLGAEAFSLPLPSGLRVADVLRFHGRDPLSLSEQVAGLGLRKAFLCEGQPSVLSLDFGEEVVRVRLEGATGPLAMAQAHEAALRLLGWHGDPVAFEGAHPELARGREGLRVLLTLDPFEALVWAILGQQVNLAFAYALRRDLIRLAGRPAAGGLIAHPDVGAIAALDGMQLQALRFSRRKAEYLLNAATAVAQRRLKLEDLHTATATNQALLALRGCGPWTAQYVLMRGFGYRDGVPVGDAGLTLALQRWFQLETRPDAPETLRLMAPFAPHRSLATFHLWASLKGVPA